MPIGIIKRLIKKTVADATQVKTQPAAKPATAAKAHPAKNTASKKPAPKAAVAKPVLAESKWDISDFQVAPQEGKTRFHDLNLDPRIMRGVQDLGFEYCSPIQAVSLPRTLAGYDLIGKAQTGTGKTAAFLVTVIQKLLTTEPKERFASEPRALILAPTRELAMQIAKDAEGLAKYAGLNVITVLGGVDYEKQKSQLFNEVVDIVVATPGRLIDYILQDVVFLDQVETLVIDEADRMLDMGFIPDLKRIISRTPPTQDRQTLLFSATFPQDVLYLCDRWTFKPEYVEIQPESVATERVEQHMYLVSEDEKLNILVRMLKAPGMEKAIIFANRRDSTRKLSEALIRRNIPALLLSGDVAQDKRTKTLDRFKQGYVNVLVATDVAGRGIHVDGITHVFNYNLPDDPEDYVHRIGRTGRAGAEGIAISLVDEGDAFALPPLERYLGKKLELEHYPAE